MKKKSRIVAAIMLIIAVIFIVFALNHPEQSFPWDNSITFGIYVIYLAIMVVLFIAPFGYKNKKENLISYYTGWGFAWGTCVGTVVCLISQGNFLYSFLPCIALGGIMGRMYGIKNNGK